MANIKGHIVMDYDKLRDYVFDMKRKSDLLCDQKDRIEKLLVGLQDDWNDTIFMETWNSVIRVSTGVKKIYFGMTESLKAVADHYDKYITAYNEIRNRLIGRLPIREYSIGIRRMEKLKGAHVTISDLDEMARFIRGMKAYIEDTAHTITDIERKHVDVGAYWKSIQYDQFAQILHEVKGSIFYELETLEQLNHWVTKKYMYLRDNVVSDNVRRGL